jgi:hypothetical protein
MKLLKYTLLPALFFIGIASSVLYTSCEKDYCTLLKCKNGGSCAEGFCRCKSGYEGTECEHPVYLRFIGVYYGTSKNGTFPELPDTMTVYVSNPPQEVSYFFARKPGKVFVGKANDTYITVDDLVVGNKKTVTHADLDGSKMNAIIEEIADINNPLGTSTFRFTGVK